MTQTFMTPNRSRALLGQLPTHFFSGLPTALQELIQNALRAGAHHLHVTLEGHVLTVQDDGAGLDDPQLLMTAGDSG